MTGLPDKEVISILDLAADVDLAIDGAAPIDLAVALNANIVAPIDAAVSANLLADGSTSQALADQGVVVNQTVDADAIATGLQDSSIDQSDTVTDGTGPTRDRRRRGPQSLMAAADAAPDGGATPPTPRTWRTRRRRAGPVDGAVVVDSAGAILGTLDSSNGTVVDSGRQHRRHAQRDDRARRGLRRRLVGSVTSLVDGASVVGLTGNVIGVLDGATGTVVDASGNVVGCSTR